MPLTNGCLDCDVCLYDWLYIVMGIHYVLSETKNVSVAMEIHYLSLSALVQKEPNLLDKSGSSLEPFTKWHVMH